MKIRHIVLIGFILGIQIFSVFAQDTPSTDSTDEETAEVEISQLSIWIPEDLQSLTNTDAAEIFQEQTNLFMENNEQVVVSTRLKLVNEVGGIMPMLRTGSAVAPGALPDLTLLRRSDLIIAQESGLIEPFEGLLPSAMMGELDAALQLGQVDGELYGIPYLLELQHFIYRPQEDVNYRSWSFSSVLQREESFDLPLGRSVVLYNVYLLQYVANGGELPTDEAEINLQEEALLDLLTFYEEAFEVDLLDLDTLNYTAPNDYLSSFQNRRVNVGLYNSTAYLRLLKNEETLMAAPIPTQSGANVSSMDGWMWVLVARDPNQQALAMEYLTWIMDVNRQGEYAESVSMVPSQQSTIEEWITDEDYRILIQSLLNNAYLPFSTTSSRILSETIQTAIASVLNGDASAEEATQSALTQTAS